MARDPLDATIIVMLDQARAIRDQLRATAPVQAAMRAVGDDPQAMLRSIQASHVAAETAWAAREYAEGTVKARRKEALALVPKAADWMSDLHHQLKRAKRRGPAVAVAVEMVRARVPQERRRFAGLYAGLAHVLDALRLHAATLSAEPLLVAATADGEGLLARMKVASDAVELAEVALRPLVAEEARLRLALLEVLRGVRADWKTAQSMAKGPVSDLNLALSKSAHANATRHRRTAKAAAAEMPAAGEATGAALASCVVATMPDVGVCSDVAPTAGLTRAD